MSAAKMEQGRHRRPMTLAVDVGGTHIKASVLDAKGAMVAERQRVDTPHPCPPKELLAAMQRLAGQLPSFDRISIGFPGAVRNGMVITAPNLVTSPWRGFALSVAVHREFGKPARILNDAEVQGLGIIAGRGLEVVLTLGTGLGSAVFSEGKLGPHLELAHIPIRKHKSYDDYVGDAARKKIGGARWNRRVKRVIAIVQTLFNFDTLYLGGGNTAHLAFDLPPSVQVRPNDAGITGCIRLWDDSVWHTVPEGGQTPRIPPQ